MNKCNFCVKSDEKGKCTVVNHDGVIDYCEDAVEKMVEATKGAVIYTHLCEDGKNFLDGSFHKCTFCGRCVNGTCQASYEKYTKENCDNAIVQFLSMCEELEDMEV